MVIPRRLSSMVELSRRTSVGQSHRSRKIGPLRDPRPSNLCKAVYTRSLRRFSRGVVGNPRNPEGSESHRTKTRGLVFNMRSFCLDFSFDKLKQRKHLCTRHSHAAGVLQRKVRGMSRTRKQSATGVG